MLGRCDHTLIIRCSEEEALHAFSGVRLTRIRSDSRGSLENHLSGQPLMTSCAMWQRNGVLHLEEGFESQRLTRCAYVGRVVGGLKEVVRARAGFEYVRKSCVPGNGSEANYAITTAFWCAFRCHSRRTFPWGSGLPRSILPF